MIISLIHPSRGRSLKASETYKFWMENASGIIEIEHILSVDNDDCQNSAYFFRFPNSKLIHGNNTCVVEATNKAALEANGDILIYLSDDFHCPADWDSLIAEKFNSVNEPRVLKIDDCLQKFSRPIITMPIMNRQLYNRLGYFWHPKYRSMYVDNDLYHTCKNNGWVFEAPDLKFEHQHHSINKSVFDETYKRSEANSNQGKEIFKKRKQLNFPICGI